MIYQETITIQHNKGKRILELCKSLGIEIYDKFLNKVNTMEESDKTQVINEYLAEYYRWTNLTKSHLKEIFLTPRILLEFDKKDVFGTTYQLNLQSHIDNVLANQIYFIESVINEIEGYKYVDGKTTMEKQNVLQRLFLGQSNKKN